MAQNINRLEVFKAIQTISNYIKNDGKKSKKVKEAFQLLSDFFNINNEKEISILSVIYYDFMSTDFGRYCSKDYISFHSLLEGFGKKDIIGLFEMQAEIDDLCARRLIFIYPIRKYIKSTFKNYYRIYLKEKSFSSFINDDENNIFFATLQDDELMDLGDFIKDYVSVSDDSYFLYYKDCLKACFPENKVASKIIDYINNNDFLVLRCLKRLSDGIYNNNIMKFKLSDILGQYYCNAEIRRCLNNLKKSKGKSPLETCGLFNITKASQIDKIEISLQPWAIKELFGIDEEMQANQEINGPVSYISNRKIKKKELFYNKENDKDIQRLFELLDDKNYKKVTKRLNDKGYKKGLTLILHGGPGTGKTETVLQLAKKTNRDILKLNIDEIRSCWVGESEKNMKNVFDMYREYMEKAKKTPILFLNEADAIISKRTDIGTNASVDKMENSLQNILLDELENFEGILIATTNLINNIDNAFDRRFLFKVKLDKPSIEVKEKIWKSKLSDVSDGIIKDIAVKFDFSGGQIDNIVKKINIDNILWGNKPNKEMLEDFCSKELLIDTKTKPIGFQK